MSKTKEELQKYAIEMRLRGESYNSILKYLKRSCADEIIIYDIIERVSLLEKNNEFKINRENPTRSVSSTNILLGSLFLGAGIILLFLLWDKGVASTFPFFMIGIGILALSNELHKKM